MVEKTFTNNELEIELTSYIDNKQNILSKGKDIALILGYVDTDCYKKTCMLMLRTKKQGGVGSKHFS